MNNVTRELANFAANLKYEDLPPEVVYESKRLLLDAIGCALAGTGTAKGKHSISLSQKLGGAPESTVIGTGNKISPPQAAFANGELMDAMEYTALLSPMGPFAPFVIAAPLAIAESVKSSGKDLITAIALSGELSSRIVSGLMSGRRFTRQMPGSEMMLGFPIQGHSVYIFGGTAGAGRILTLGEDDIRSALGIAGYMCPIPLLMKFATTLPSSMTKHLSAGWLSQAEVTAALLAEEGYHGDKEILNGDYGFWRAFGSDAWIAEAVNDKLGSEWRWPGGRLYYKPYPCCAGMHDALHYFYDIIEQNHLKADDIEEIHASLSPVVELPLWQNRQIELNVEAQFSAAYVFAVAAHGIDIGIRWQMPETFRDPTIIDFMNRVKINSRSEYSRTAETQPTIKVVVRDRNSGINKTFSSDNMIPHSDFMSNEDLIAKFKNNASGLLSQHDTERVADLILNLEDLQDISGLL
jgi:2-methylcitrate dehydratase PrpD